MPAARFVLTFVAAAALLAGVSSAGASTPTLPRPTGLKAFLLTTGEPDRHAFPRTPSFAWNPVRGALRYEFQLSTSMRFNEGSVVWSNVEAKTEPAPGTGSDGTEDDAAPTTQALPATLRQLRSPALALDIALPWITGEPFGLYARVRAVLRQGSTRWSDAFGFNVRWPNAPEPQADAPGLIRWNPVEGATSYEVWISGAKKIVATTTNVADLRDLYNFHQTPSWTRNVYWRVRAIREVYGKAANGLPATSRGPWSAIYGSTNPDFVASGPLTLGVTLSDSRISDSTGTLHRLMPAFTWTGTSGQTSGVVWPSTPELWRVYVATDRDCINVVFRGAVVGSPAYAPRALGGLKMPHDDKSLADARLGTLDIGPEGDALSTDGDPITPSEQVTGTAGATDGTAVMRSKTDLWDSAWPNGGYYWTVVPVVMELKDPGADGKGTGFRYRDLELPQDACRSGRVLRFGKSSDRVVTSGDTAYATGMSTRGLLVSASGSSPKFYGTPLVAWQPALGAESYEVQWAKSGYPWRTLGTATTSATSALLPLTPGHWYYRVRGLNADAVSKPEMAWSVPVRLEIAKPVFAIRRSGR